MSGVMVKVERELDQEFISNILITAFDANYGGSWYWAKPVEDEVQVGDVVEREQRNEPGRDSYWTAVHIRSDEPIGIASLDAKQEKGWFTVNAEAIRVGIQKILDQDEHAQIRDDLRQQVYSSVLEGDADIDSNAADCIVQIGLFGRLIFG